MSKTDAQSPAKTPVVPSENAALTRFQEGTALLRAGRIDLAESHLREAVRLDDHLVDAWVNLGMALWLLRRPIESEQMYRRALEINPRNASALSNLGNLFWDQMKLSEAAGHYRSALEINPNLAEATLNLGVVLSDLGDLDEATSWINRALELRPGWPQAINNLGMTLARLGQSDDAMACYEEALTREPSLADAQRNRGYLRLARGEFERGWIDHEARLRCRNHRGLRPNHPRWNGSALNGRTILLHSEQGLGDCLQFVRYAKLVKAQGGNVVVACAPSLARLLALCPFIDVVASRPEQIPACDVEAPLMSLPLIFGTTLENLPASIPYLVADTATRARWREIIASATADQLPEPHRGPRPYLIGVAWRGNPLNRVDPVRSFPIENLRHLTEIPRVRLVSLQVGTGSEDVAKITNLFPIVTLEDATSAATEPRDFLDSAGMIDSLDLVICPDTAVAHLAGAMGAKVWLALSHQGEWRWMLDREDSPWYPSMRIFRQPERSDWPGVFRRMTQALLEELTPK